MPQQRPNPFLTGQTRASRPNPFLDPDGAIAAATPPEPSISDVMRKGFEDSYSGRALRIGNTPLAPSEPTPEPTLGQRAASLAVGIGRPVLSTLAGVTRYAPAAAPFGPGLQAVSPQISEAVESAEDWQSKHATPGETMAGEFIGTGAQYMLGGEALGAGKLAGAVASRIPAIGAFGRTLAGRVLAPAGRAVADAVPMLPVDVATTLRPKESTAHAAATLLDTEGGQKASEWVKGSGVGPLAVRTVVRALGADPDNLQESLHEIANDPVRRPLLETKLGIGVDALIRTLATGAKAGTRATLGPSVAEGLSASPLTGGRTTVPLATQPPTRDARLAGRTRIIRTDLPDAPPLEVLPNVDLAQAGRDLQIENQFNSLAQEIRQADIAPEVQGFSATQPRPNTRRTIQPGVVEGLAPVPKTADELLLDELRAGVEAAKIEGRLPTTRALPGPDQSTGPKLRGPAAGAVSPELAATLARTGAGAAVGAPVGAALDPENRGRGAVAGAVVGGAGAAVLPILGRVADNLAEAERVAALREGRSGEMPLLPIEESTVPRETLAIMDRQRAEEALVASALADAEARGAARGLAGPPKPSYGPEGAKDVPFVPERGLRGREGAVPNPMQYMGPEAREGAAMLSRTAVGAGAGGLAGAADPNDQLSVGQGIVAGGAAGLAGPAFVKRLKGMGKAGHAVVPGASEGVPTGLKGKWYSRLQNAISAGPGRATGSEWDRFLHAGKRGFAEGEADWSGIRNYLRENADVKLSKDDVLGYARERGVRLEERVLGKRAMAWKKTEDGVLYEANSRARIERLGNGKYRLDIPGLQSQLFGDRGMARRAAEDAIGLTEKPPSLFQQYTQPGGENYREVLVKLGGEQRTPTNAIRKDGYWEVRDQNGEFVSNVMDYDFPESVAGPSADDALHEAGRRMESGGSVRFAQSGFTSFHWPDDPSTLTHLRMTDRTINGEKTLFIEEIQSDWHQKGRESGYREGPYVRPEGSGGRTENMEEALALHDRRMEEMNRVPDAPYKKTDEWVGLSVRRALQEAVDGGYDRIAWASGEQSAGLYDLRKQVGRIDYEPRSGLLRAWDTGNNYTVIERHGVKPEELPDIIGKEPSRKLLESEPRTVYGEAGAETAHAIEGDDLAVGGEGMLEFYDRIVPKVFQKEAKALGLDVEIEPARVGTGEEITVDLIGDDARPSELRGKYEVRVGARHHGTYNTKAKADEVAATLRSAEPTAPTNLSIKITPEARQAVKGQGTRLYARGGPTLLGGAIGYSTGDTPEERVQRGLAGAALGAGLEFGPTVARRLRGDNATDIGKIASEIVPTPKPEPFRGAVDPDNYANLAKFAMDPTGEQRLAREVERVVREQGIAPKTRVTLEDTRALARTLGIDPQDFTTKVLQKNGLMNHAEIVASRDVVKNNVTLIADLEKKIGSGTLDATQMAEAQAALTAINNQTDNLIAKFSRDRTETGRALSAHRALANETLDPLVWLSRFRRQLGVDVPEEVKARVLALIEAEDRAGLAKLGADLEESDTVDQVLALWKAGLLSAPTTHEVNVVSTAANVGLENVKDPVAAAQDALLTGALQLVARAGGHDASKLGRSKSVTGLGATLTGAKRGVRDFKLGLQGKAGSSEVASRWDYKQTNIDLVPDVLGGKIANPILDAYQKGIFRLLGAEDKFFKATRIEQSIYEQSRVVALNEKAPNVASRAKEIYEGWKTDGYAGVPNDVAMQAIADGALATFTDRSTLAKAASGLKRTLQQASDKPDAGLAAKSLKLLVGAVAPFTGTPSNVVSRVAEYSGGGLLSGGYDVVKLVRKAFKGEADQALQRRAVESLARGTTGAGLLAIGYVLYNKGKMTLNYPSNAGERGNWEVTGKQEFSLLQDGEWKSLERVSPVGNLLAVGGYMARAMQGLSDPEESRLSLATEPMLGVGSMVMNQSFMSGTKEFLDALSSGEDPDSNTASRYVKRQAGSVIPNIVKRVAAALDTDKNGRVQVRQTDSWVDAVKYGIPILRETLPVARDQFGEQRLRGGPMKEFVDLTYSTKDLTTGDPVRAEFARLGAPITRRQRNRNGGETSAQFSDRLEEEGQALHEVLGIVMQSAVYKNAEEAAREVAQSGGFPDSEIPKIADFIRREILSDVISGVRRDFTNKRKLVGGR